MIYLFDYSKISIDSFLAFCLGILFAVTINAEAQAFIAQFLGDMREKDENRFHFNCFRHLDLPGTILFFIASFGWPKKVDIDSNKFTKPVLHTIIVRFAGPIANLFLASIISSISLIIEQFSIEAQMLQIVIGINLMVAAANLLPIPPMASASIIDAFIGEKYKTFKRIFWQAGPYLLVLIFIADRMMNNSFIVNRLIIPIILPVFKFFIKTYSFGT